MDAKPDISITIFLAEIIYFCSVFACFYAESACFERMGVVEGFNLPYIIQGIIIIVPLGGYALLGDAKLRQLEGLPKGLLHDLVV